MAEHCVLCVAVDELAPDPDQPRKRFGEEGLALLARSLMKGQLQPVLAFRRERRWVIIDGERRWRAAKLAGLKVLQVLEVSEPVAADQGLARQLVANLHREDLSPLERADAIRRLMEECGWTAARAAEELALSAATVSRLLRLLSLPDSVKERVASGAIPASTAYQLAKRNGAAEPTELAAEIEQGAMSRDEVARLLSEKSGGGKSSSGRALRRVARLGGDRTITFAGSGLETVQQLVEWLEQLLARAKKVRAGPVSLDTFLRTLHDEARAAKGGGAA